MADEDDVSDAKRRNPAADGFKGRKVDVRAMLMPFFRFGVHRMFCYAVNVASIARP